MRQLFSRRRTLRLHRILRLCFQRFIFHVFGVTATSLSLLGLGGGRHLKHGFELNPLILTLIDLNVNNVTFNHRRQLRCFGHTRSLHIILTLRLLVLIINRIYALLLF